MVINFCGEGCFKIQTSGGTTILTEGFSGDTSARMKPDIFIRTKGAEPFDKLRAEHVILGPGEYEIKGIEIRGYPKFVYHLKTEDMELGFMGLTDIKEPAFDPDVTEKLKDVDILFVYDSVEGAKIVRQLHPHIVISHSGSAANLEKELGKKAEIMDKLVIKKKEVPAEAIGKLICLKI